MQIKYPEIAEDDPRPIADPELEFEADKSGMIHVRKSSKGNEVLPGYGVTDFGVSPFEEKRSFTAGSFLIGAGVGAAGILAWKFRDEINNHLQVLSDYALLMRESMRDDA